MQDTTARLIGGSPPVTPTPTRAILLLHLGNHVIHTYLEPLTAVVLGRDSTAQVIVPEASVSKRHARLTFDGKFHVIVEDLGSTNGTMLKGHEIRQNSPVAVGHGAELYFGTVLGIVYIPGAAVVVPSPEDTAKTKALDGEIVADAPAMKRLLETAEPFARASATVVITGETGSGKEEIAKWIHQNGPRKDKPFVVLNCGTIEPHLLQSTLFGHEKGSFTGASMQTKGYFEEAHGGTLLLDEIGELPAEAQRALLRVLETGKITRVGAVREIAVDVRIMAATWRNLRTLCEQDKFRWDLYHRLHVLTLHVPPLRERREDIPKLVGRFLQRANKANGRSVQGIENDALTMLEAFDWPGNVRDLRNWIERAVVVARGEKITSSDLPPHIEEKTQAYVGTNRSLDKDLEALEKEKIIEALRQTNNNTTEAATVLGYDLRKLQRRMRHYDIKSKPRGKP